jgi:hypothetical protein
MTTRQLYVCTLLLACSSAVARVQAQPSLAKDQSDGHDLHVHADPSAESGGGLGYDAEEGFRFKSEDGAYMLRVALQIAIKVEPSWNDGDHTYNGTFAFLRPILRGNFYKPWLGYRLSMDLSGEDPTVLDAYIDVARWDAFGLRIGQQVTPASRHSSFGPAQIFFPEFAGVSSYFWSGRDRGITLYGTVLDERLDYYAGAFSGSPIDSPVNLEDNYIVEGRLTVNPFGPVNENELPFTPEGGALPGRVSFTVQGFHGRLQTDLESYNDSHSILMPQQPVSTKKTSSASGDLWLQKGRLIAFGEFYWRTQKENDAPDSIGAYGAWGQVILNAYKNLIGVGARCNWIDPNNELPSDRALEFEGQVAWFIHPPEVVLKLRYAWLDQKTPGAARLGEFTLPFVTGTSNLATLQLTMAF